ncbi:MAG: phosphoribosylglycinamide formyltransferase [Planctomycetes bacterium]|nr:phosphoribosylglycinamide formyltransferase [Planctomycetota bacterium]MCB9829576.1 phosphoribosylglycinamide formyltransferase [Planctomycetota bacterium]MCB9902221.1 phosphoribosylglycinamide formyltransferase [Planctomycetota bacterium]
MSQDAMAGTPARIAFLLSGSGSTLANLLAAIERGDVAATIVAAVADRTSATGLEHARRAGVPALVVPRREHKGASYTDALLAALAPHRPDWIVLGGFLTCFPLPPDWAGRVVNVHPSLLPAFGGKGCYGHHVHEMVLERGCRVSGCTVHLVDDVVDGGPIVEQVAVPVRDDDTADTLAARVQAAERDVYPRVIDKLVRGVWRHENGRVVRDEE